MTKQRDQLIAELVADAKPVRRANPSFYLVTWLSISTLFSFIVMSLIGPFRDGAVNQLLQHPQFSIEILLGISAIIALGRAGFRSAIPSPTNQVRTEFLVPLVLLGLWLLIQVYAVLQPALPPSMAGKREDCWIEAFSYGLPGLIFGSIWLNRLWPLKPGWTGFSLGLSAGAIPAVLMQMACMYGPLHNLTHHTLPGLVLGLIGSLIGICFLKRK